MPVPVLVGSPRTMSRPDVPDCRPAAHELVEAFWPGGLTVVVRAGAVAAAGTWATPTARSRVRMPLHPVAIELLTEVGPMAVSSANRSGEPPATTVDEAQAQLGDSVAVYLDGGPSGAAVPSSIVDLTGASRCCCAPAPSAWTSCAPSCPDIEAVAG